MKEIRLEFLRKALETDEEGRTQIENRFEEMRVKYMARMDCLDPNYDDTIDEEKLRAMLYFGDDRGLIKLWDLTYVLELAGVVPCQAYWEVKGD